MQPDRRLRHQRNVASVQGEQRALEGDVDLRRRARQPRVARLAAVVLDDDDDDDDGEDDEDEDDDDEDAAGGWDMWQSPSILDYSLAALRGPP